MMPPKPLGKGQRSVVGSEEASAVAASPPPASRTERNLSWPSLCRVSKDQPQQTTGGRTATTATPLSCMIRSAAMAPAGPA